MIASSAYADMTEPGLQTFRNVVIFPKAPGFEAKIVKVEPFPIDERLIGLRGGPQI